MQATLIKYPEVVIRVMKPQIVNLRAVVSHHYRNRHDGRGSKCVRAWVAELRRIDKASGYSEALKQINKA